MDTMVQLLANTSEMLIAWDKIRDDQAEIKRICGSIEKFFAIIFKTLMEKQKQNDNPFECTNEIDVSRIMSKFTTTTTTPDEKNGDFTLDKI
jgi:hypothetical protein